MLLDEKIRKEITPKRVYSTLKFIAQGRFTEKNIMNIIQPPGLCNGKQDEIKKVLKYIQDTRLVVVNQEIFELNFDKKHLRSGNEFRKYFASRVFEGNDSNLFFDFTSWYLYKGNELLVYSTMDDVISNQNKFKELNKEFGLAWRFWATFIGIGYMHESQFIPNPYLRIKDAIECDVNIKRGKEIRVSDFINWCLMKCPELKENINGHNISFTMSFALRTLHDMGVIKLSLTQDATEVWDLYRMELHDIPECISEIIIKESE
ncbi:hypothetical protein [Oceanirhabdus seepicola]|uniref:Uncharacterized protein n=1 Tax=Oceanirhabdus seepicola TaxID=2828781 RepID=A0A9J6NWE0_9CLOT|nr:hypothetical protein [Oceanirhabdus seepicola]MCM1988826.1 hypothetical protein [Oceanirhabdus seepicola]